MVLWMVDLVVDLNDDFDGELDGDLNCGLDADWKGILGVLFGSFYLGCDLEG